MINRPLVIVPGVMASRLYFKHPDIYWDPDNYLRMLKWYLLRDYGRSETLKIENPAGVVTSARRINQSQQDRGWGSVVWSFYGDFIESMEAHRGNVWVVGYDWRQNIWTGIGNLAMYLEAKLKRIQQLTGQNELIVVAHSMGSLVMRTVLKSNPGLARAIIYVCPPVVGAPVLYRKLFTGMQRRYDAGLLENWLIGDTAEGFSQNISGMPGPIQLLPSEHYPHNIDGGHYWNSYLPSIPHAQLYSNVTRPPGIHIDGLMVSRRAKAAMRTRIGEVDAFHNNLGKPHENIPLENDSYLIYGNNVETDIRIEFNSGHFTFYRRKLGDQTVPADSATAMPLPGRTKELRGITHAEACNDSGVIQEVKRIDALY